MRIANQVASDIVELQRLSASGHRLVYVTFHHVL